MAVRLENMCTVHRGVSARIFGFIAATRRELLLITRFFFTISCKCQIGSGSVAVALSCVNSEQSTSWLHPTPKRRSLRLVGVSCEVPCVERVQVVSTCIAFVGLENQGATCYLNSLLQALYLTPEIRQGLYDLTDDELGLDQLEEYEALTQKLKKGIVKPSSGDIETLRKKHGCSESKVRPKTRKKCQHSIAPKNPNPNNTKTRQKEL